MSRRKGGGPPSRIIAELGDSLACFIGMSIKKEREAKGMTLKELAIKAGLSNQNPKQRMWEIENDMRGWGIRIGTLYAIAIALNVEPAFLLPTLEDIKAIFGDDIEEILKRRRACLEVKR